MCVAGRPADGGELQSEPCSVQDEACVPPTLPFGPSLTSLHTPEGSLLPSLNHPRPTSGLLF